MSFLRLNMTINFKEIKLIPNIISIFRFLLIIPLFIVFLEYNESSYRNDLLIGLIILAFLSDISDGYIARKYNQISDLGKIIDPLADKLLVATLVIFMYLFRMLPSIYMLIIVLRDILILIGGIYIKIKYNIILQSDYVGKATVFLIGLTLLSTLVFSQNYWITFYLDIVSGLMCFVSLINYFIKSRRAIKLNG